LVTYHGGGMPEGDTARQQAMTAFAQWVSKTGTGLVDPGVPLGPAKTVSKASVTDGPLRGHLVDIRLVEADDISAPIELVRDHPFIARGGSLQVTTGVAP
jgi:hypothetical protein